MAGNWGSVGASRIIYVRRRLTVRTGLRIGRMVLEGKSVVQRVWGWESTGSLLVGSVLVLLVR